MVKKIKKTPKKDEKRLTFKEKAIEQIKSILSIAFFFILITSAVVEGSLVPTPSMDSTIKVGDRLFINKFIFGAATPRNIPFTNIELPYTKLPALREPKRNDILVFRFPGDQSQLKDDAVEYWVKRCIGQPGDTVQIINKIIFVNGQEFPIPNHIQYLYPSKPNGVKDRDIFPANMKWNSDNYGPIVIPQKGDVIKLTKDNLYEYAKLINIEHGKKVVSLSGDQILINNKPVKEYTVKENYYFMIGDNRDNSLDSRFWGFVPRENIVGTPIIIYFSWDSDIPFFNIFNKLGSIRLDRIAKLID